MTGNILQHLKAYLLGMIFGLLFIFQVFHAYAEYKVKIALQQDAQPVIILTFSVFLQKFPIGFRMI